MLPSETMIWQPEFTDKTLSRKPGAVQTASIPVRFAKLYREANSRHGHLKEPAFCGFFYD
ncbi:hypothetical protein CR536_15970 [Escherichia coli]|nr:hypothetical protein CR536_15970 [Escherichia coli]